MMKLIVSFCLCLMTGCAIPNFKDYANAWVGEPIERYLAVTERPTSYASRNNWKEETYYLDNGHKVYVYPEGSRCIVHWEVNEEGIIVGYQAKGQCD